MDNDEFQDDFLNELNKEESDRDLTFCTSTELIAELTRRYGSTCICLVSLNNKGEPISRVTHSMANKPCFMELYSSLIGTLGVLSELIVDESEDDEDDDINFEEYE